MIFALQLFSWQPGGLKKVVNDFLAQFVEEISTPSMRKFGRREGAGSIIRSKLKPFERKIPDGRYPLYGEYAESDSQDEFEQIISPEEWRRKAKSGSLKRPAGTSEGINLFSLKIIQPANFGSTARPRHRKELLEILTSNLHRSES